MEDKYQTWMLCFLTLTLSVALRVIWDMWKENKKLRYINQLQRKALEIYWDKNKKQ